MTPIEEPLIKEIKSLDMVENLRLEVSFNKTTSFPKGLHHGIKHATSSVDYWWPSAIANDYKLTCY